MEPSVKSVKKDFVCKKENLKLKMTTVSLGNILIAESDFVKNSTQVTKAIQRKSGFSNSRSMSNE